jgi:hypothetical protein
MAHPACLCPGTLIHPAFVLCLRQGGILSPESSGICTSVDLAHFLSGGEFGLP